MTRFRRDTGYEVSFPPQMEFSVTFRDKKISLLMSRNLHMTSTPEMFDENGKITHNSQVRARARQNKQNYLWAQLRLRSVWASAFGFRIRVPIERTTKTCHTVRTPRLIWVLAWSTGHFVCFLVYRLICVPSLWHQIAYFAVALLVDDNLFTLSLFDSFNKLSLASSWASSLIATTTLSLSS